MEEVKPPSILRSFGSFMNAWRKAALGGVWGKTGDTATVLGLVVPAISHGDPVFWHKVILFMHVSGNEALLWEAPVAVGGSILLVRVVLAPFWIVRSERESAKNALAEATTRTELQAQAHQEELAKQREAFEASTEGLERRIAELEAPSPRIVVEVTDDTERPFLLRNAGPVEAHRVRILPIVDGTWTVEFDAVDTIYSSGSGNPRLLVSRSDGEIGLLFQQRFSHFLTGVLESRVDDLRDTATGEPVTPEFAARLDAAFGDMVSAQPMVIEYSNDSGNRTFRTEYNYRANPVGENLSVEFVRRYVATDR